MSKMTFAEKLKLQKQEEHGSEVVPEQVEVQEKPKKTRKPRKKKTEEVQEVSEEVPEQVQEKPKRKPRKKKEEDVVEGGSVESEVKKPKEKRPPSAYNLFVKEAYKSEKVQKLPPKERFAKVAELWHKHKGKK